MKQKKKVVEYKKYMKKDRKKYLQTFKLNNI